MPELARWFGVACLTFALGGCGSGGGGDSSASAGPGVRLAESELIGTTSSWNNAPAPKADESGKSTGPSPSTVAKPPTAADPIPTEISGSGEIGSGPVLAQLAATLAPGQSRKLATPLTGAILTFGAEGSNFIQWGSSGFYDPTRKEIGFIGKRDGPNRYHWLVYHEATNTWTNDRPVWDSATYSGHGYDHNTIDPATGTIYHRQYNDKAVHVWNGTWSRMPAWSENTSIVGGLSWFPGVGLIYNDGAYLLRFNGGMWSVVADFGGGSYHDFSEYNSTANALIFGSGNSSPLRKMTSDLAVSTVASPPFNIGAGSSQGVCISDPNSAMLVAYQKGTTNWAQYDIRANAWSSLAQSTGDGSVPQNGTPNLVGGNQSLAVIGIPIPQYGVLMFIQQRGSGSTRADVWIYRHS